MLLVNFGCGDNRLPGWRNHDEEVNICQRLPYADGEVDYILCEHCVEHVTYLEAIDFFRECVRVLRRGGVARIIVPSVEQILDRSTLDYWRFTTKWQNLGPTKRGALDAIIRAHGHKMVWAAGSLRAVMYYSGFGEVEHVRQSGHSMHPELANVDGHGKVIGHKFNELESCIVEGTKV